MSDDGSSPAKPAGKKVQVSCSPGFLEWLADEGIGVAFTTYQTNRLFLVGRDDDGGLAAFERLLDRPMGLSVTAERLWVATRFQLWRFDQVLAAGDRYRGHDRLYVPRVGHVSGELDAHDVHQVGEAAGAPGSEVLFVNTLYSCLARPAERHSFEAVWRPPFVSKLVPEDRCHLNGVALDGGRPRFATAVARTDERQGWRAHRADGGLVLDVDSGEVVASGLSMPHSPRLHDGRLYVLNSGHGELGRVDLAAGRFEPVAFCPGYLRGLAFRGDSALVGLSKPRDKTFQGLPLDRRLAAEDAEPRCALWVIDLETGEPRHWLEVHGVVLELYDVAIVPETVRPMALGFKSDELRRIITFEEEGRPIRHELRRLEAGTARPESSPLPRRRTDSAGRTDAADAAGTGARAEVFGGAAADGEAPEAAEPRPPVAPAALPARIAARTLEVSLKEALARSELTFPDLRRTAASRPLREPLLATVLTATGNGVPPGPEAPEIPLLAAAVSVVRPGGGGAEVVSFVVRSELRRRGLGKLLLAGVEAELARRGLPAVDLAFRDTWASAGAMRALLAARGWSEPRTQVLMAQTDTRILALPWLDPRPLPPGYEIFPWGELTAEERREIVRRQQRAPWYPEALSPFQLEERIDLEVSVGVRRHAGGESRVIGWLLAHRAKPDVVQYTTLFVEEGHAKLGRGLPLIAAAARRQDAAGLPRAIFMVQAGNPEMRRLVERRLAPYLTERAELLRSSKRILPLSPPSP
jgi:uncharacterized protein (TIGR03032 family)